MKTEYIDSIEHTATVVKCDGQNRRITVRIDTDGECGACPAARLCAAASKDGRTVSVPMPRRGRQPKPGDRVTVRGTERMHRRAIMLATVLPCIALVAVMTLVYVLTFSQAAAALSGIGAMTLFFLLLYLCRNRVEHEFEFEVVAADGSRD